MDAPAANATFAIDVARTFFTAYNAHQVDKMVALCSDDTQLRYVPMGKDSRCRSNPRHISFEFKILNPSLMELQDASS